MATTPSWVAANADGRVELFIPGAEIQNNQFTNVQLFHKWQVRRARRRHGGPIRVRRLTPATLYGLLSCVGPSVRPSSRVEVLRIMRAAIQTTRPGRYGS
jgi:hypothetical protein